MNAILPQPQPMFSYQQAPIQQAQQGAPLTPEFADCLTTQQDRDALITLVGIHTSATDVGVLIPGRNASLGWVSNQCQRNQGFNSLHVTHSELGITLLHL